MAFENLFSSISSSYSSVSSFFDDLGGMDSLSATAKALSGKSNDEKATPRGIMGDSGSDVAMATMDSMSPAEQSAFEQYLKKASSTKSKRQARQSKLDNRPESMDYNQTESMWIKRLGAIATGSVYGQQDMESK
jgi:hypothetical protein